jgi:hypothetical protein
VTGKCDNAAGVCPFQPPFTCAPGRCRAGQPGPTGFTVSESSFGCSFAPETAAGLRPGDTFRNEGLEWPEQLDGPTWREELGDSDVRKATPVYSGFVSYFPLAMMAVAQLSYGANEKHNPGEPLHWSKHKSNDHRDCIARHLVQGDSYDDVADHDYHYHHAVKLAWRAMANLEILLEDGVNPRRKKDE